MNENLTTFLYELANFVVFALLLGRIFVKPVRAWLDEQSATDARLLQTAEQNLAEAARLRQQLNKDRQTFDQGMEHQRQAMLVATRQDAANLLKQARQQIESERERLSRESLQVQQQQLTDLAGAVAMSAGQAVENLLRQIDGPPLEDALVESACRQLRQSDGAGDGKLTVDSPGTLDEPTRQKIARAAGMDSTNCAIEYRVDQELLGGLRIMTPRGVIDNSIAALSSFAEQKIRRHLTQTQ